MIEGGRSWRIGGGAVIDVPAGTRLRHTGSEDADYRYIVMSFEDVASGWWQSVNATTLEGAGRGRDVPAADGAQASDGGRDVPAILDGILKSLRRVPAGSK